MTDKELKELTAMLPFYVNGTLKAEDRARVEAGLRTSRELAASLMAERAIDRQVRQGTDAVLAEAEANFGARQADTMTAAKPKPTANNTPAPEAAPERTGLAAALGFLNPRRWSPAVALTLAVAAPLQLAVIMSQTGTIASLEKENFELASGQSGAHDRTQGIIIEIADDTPWSAVVALLDEHGLTIVESGGFGVLTVDSGVKGEERTAIINALRANPIVQSAEPEA